MALSGEWRGPRGWSPGKSSICCRISGDALSRNHDPPSALTATLSCVRATARAVPSRSPRQFAQPQFHCGNPPPAAEPRTRMRTIYPPRRDSPPAGVHRRGGLQEMSRAIELEAVVLLPLEIVLVGVDLGVHLDLQEFWRF